MRKAIIGLIVVAVLATTAVMFLRRGYVYEIAEADIQSRMESQFPVDRCVLVFCIELTEPFVRLQDGQTRIQFGSNAQMEVAFSNEQYDGKAGYSGELTYVNEEGGFFVEDSKLEYLEVNGISEEHKKNVDQLAALLVSEYLRTNPIYSFNGTMLELVASWLELKEVSVEDGVLRIRFGLVS